MQPPVRDYRSYSFWLEDAGEALTPRPQLTRSSEVDVAILGAGYSGLWTAYYLLLHEPALRVAVVEKEIAGFGASGRNGGWCSPNFPVTASGLEKRFGAEKARNLLLAMRAAVHEVGRVSREENIDAQFHQGGVLTLARGSHQLPAIRAACKTYERLGLGDRYRLLSAEETAERIRVTGVQGALYTQDGASLHPGRLVRGLARAVEARGGVIYEQTPVTGFKPGSLITPGGELRAKRAVVIAGEAYVTRLPPLHRSLLPVYSLISLTEPLTAAQWSQIGWQGGESVSSTRNTVVYLTKTSGGRILFGSRGAPYAFGSKITDEQDTHTATVQMIQPLGAGVVPFARGHSFHPCVGWAGRHASRLDAGRTIRRRFSDRFDHGLYGAGCFHQQSGRAAACGSDHGSEERTGRLTAGTEKLPSLGDRTFAMDGCALYAERFSAYRRGSRGWQA